ncbi:MAG: SpaH/EbpB family LPXTG-anchored major pilin [Clostridiales bacterium]|jgi:fimbrial isopeptide formation D2 family protein|nr:SpaH/EbpB family LPXTG-anchored major pilin [Clostridiales bacterium]
MKRFLSMIVASFVAVSSAAPVMAAAVPAESDKGSITINKTVAGKKYDIYRIFDMTMNEAGDRFSYTINPSFKDFFDSKGYANRAAAVEFVTGLRADDLAAFSNEAKEYALAKQKAGTFGDGVMYTATAAGTQIKFENIPLGYYLFYPEGTSNGLCNLTTAGPNAEIDLKGDYPTVDKTIAGGAKGASHTVGDVVDYQLKAVVPDMTGYTKYHFIFKDKMSKGLTFDENSVVVKVDGNVLAEADYELTAVPGGSDSTDIKIVFVDFYNKYKEKTGADIVVTYSATVNDNAVTGAEGNSNNASIVYSNDPNYDYEGENEPGPNDPDPETPIDPEDIVKVFVFDLSAKKVDGTELTRVISDAEFSLWTTKANSAETKNYTDNGGNDITLYLVTKTLKSDAEGKFNYKIGAGEYYLFEEKAPAGYVLNDEPIVFTIAAVINNNELEGLTVTPSDAFTADADTGIVATNITNFADHDGEIRLPGTGGMGTKIFMAGGGLLMIGSITGMFISSKKKAGKVQ